MINTHRNPQDRRRSERDSFRPITFFCDAPRARSVQIVGDFNHWRPAPMERRVDGWWYCQLMLSQGRHQYRYLVDGRTTLDRGASGVDRDNSGRPVSLITVT